MGDGADHQFTTQFELFSICFEQSQRRQRLQGGCKGHFGVVVIWIRTGRLIQLTASSTNQANKVQKHNKFNEQLVWKMHVRIIRERHFLKMADIFWAQTVSEEAGPEQNRAEQSRTADNVLETSFVTNKANSCQSNDTHNALVYRNMRSDWKWAVCV